MPKISPLDIRNRTFNTKFKGYDPKEVQLFLGRTAEVLNDALLDVKKIKEALWQKNEELENLRAREATLKESMMNAHNMVKSMREQAHKESQIIMAQAEERAEQIVLRAQRQVDNLREELLRLKMEKSSFINKIKSLMNLQLELFAEEELEAQEVREDKVKTLRKV
jgi:cell division initiation protein